MLGSGMTLIPEPPSWLVPLISRDPARELPHPVGVAARRGAVVRRCLRESQGLDVFSEQALGTDVDDCQRFAKPHCRTKVIQRVRKPIHVPVDETQPLMRGRQLAPGEYV